MFDVKKMFSKDIGEKKCSDSGLAVILVLILLGILKRDLIFYYISAPIILLLMLYPKTFYPFAFIWLGISELVGTFMSKVILTLVFCLIVFPIGIIRRMMGKDTLLLKQWKKSHSSVLKIRDHLYNQHDLDNPY